MPYTPPVVHNHTDRILYLDALRGVAILCVTLFHAYYRWSAIEPFQQTQFIRSVFEYGWVGVNLFFAISGYVIYMSLRRAECISSFMKNRYLRLAPAMIMCGLITYALSYYISEKPFNVPRLTDLISNITLIDPEILNKITDLNVRNTDDVYWSLYIEVEFYILCGVFYFLLKDKHLIGITIIYIIKMMCAVSVKVGIDPTFIKILNEVLEFIGVKYYAWFLLGIYAYKYTENANRQHLVYATLLTIMGSAHLMLKYEVTLFLIINLMLIYLIFILPVCFGKLQRFLSVKPLVFIGSISYPFYLLHQNIVTGAAITAFKSGLDVPVIFYPIPFIILVGIVSYGIARTEPNIRALFKRQRVSTVIS